MKYFGLVFLLITSAVSAEAVPRFAKIFADHAVLQREKPISIFGSGAEPGSKIEVQFGGEIYSATIVEDGKWRANIPALVASDEGRRLELRENGVVTQTIADVVVGDVWLAAGQSNMQFRVSGMLKGLPETKAWIDGADRNQIRFRRVDDEVLAERNSEVTELATPEKWAVMTPVTVLNFSAVAAVFAFEIERELDIPVGIIDVSWGGKPIEPFIPREAFATPFLEEIRNLADAEKLDELAKLRGGVIIRNPQGYPGAIFNARMALLTSFGVRGFLWYQAESNAGTGEDPREYRHKMAALFSGWRGRWQDEALPCYFVQLPSYPPATGWIRVREEQRRALEIPNTGMAVVIDLPGDDIHPPMKIPVGNRLARLALAGTYQRKNIVASGPMFQKFEVDGEAAEVSFSGTDGGLKISNGDELKWFELTGGDGVWHSAKAKIKGEQVFVKSDAVSNPVAVRYACATNPRGGNLVNGAGLPASPFCSDLEMLPWVDPPKKK